MNNVLLGTDSKFCLIGKIKGLAVEAKRARDRLLKSTSDKAVCRLAYRKRIVSIDVRHHLLAYAFLRGVPYNSIEKNCRFDNKPKAAKILEIAHQHIVLHWEITQGHWSLEKVNQWLAGDA